MTFLALRLLGGDVAMLQVVAWTGMIVSRSADRGVAAAVQSTFEGNEPCPLCKVIREVQEKDPGPGPVTPPDLQVKLQLKDMVPPDGAILPQPQCSPRTLSVRIMGRNFCVAPRRDAPPVPPPRNAIV